MKFIILLIVIVAIFAISITLGAQNNQIVTFNYLIGQTDSRMSTILALLFGSGFIIGWLVTGVFFLRAKLQLNATKRKLKKVQKLYDDEMIRQKKEQLTTPITTPTTTDN